MRNTLSIIALISSLLLSNVAVAQFDFGLKGGVNSSTLTFEDFEENSSVSEITAENEWGYHVGAYVRLKVLGIYLQPEVLYSRLSSTIEVNKTSGNKTSSEFSLSRFDIPVNLGIKLGPASIFGGPVMSYNLNQPSDILDIDYSGGTLGYQAGVGLTIGDFIMDLKYEGSFQSLADEVVIDGRSYKVDARTGQFILSLGYAIF